MIALLAAAAAAALALAPSAALPPLAAPGALAPAVLPPDEVLARYADALAALKEPRVFVVEYTMEQTGPRVLEQTHRIFRSGGDERDEILAVNGTRTSRPAVRIFHRRPFRYTVAALSPKPKQYDFTYLGAHRSGRHVEYVFHLAPLAAKPAFAFTQVTIDGLTFLPATVDFATSSHGGAGSVRFVKADRWWVPRLATARARVPGGVTREQIAFLHWRFPPSLPPSTFAAPRPLPTAPPAISP